MKNNNSSHFDLDVKALHRWFLTNKRDLPWRSHPEPYAVWISEVMLQQTQVAVVIPFFERWMKLFPSVRALSEATLDQVIKAWEGLGYYSRARHLHEAAHYIMENFQGRFPSSEIELKKIKGLGPYTIGAILSFAFHHKMPAVDGNVMRVLTRYFWIPDDINQSKTQQFLRKVAAEILPEEDHWVTNEALIELGATVCKKTPACSSCPLRPSCVGYAKGRSAELPYKSLRMKSQKLWRAVPVILCDQKVLVKRGEKGKLMSDLHEFPFFEVAGQIPLEELQSLILDQLSLQVIHQKSLEPVKHGFTRYQATLFPEMFRTPAPLEVQGYTWIDIQVLQKLALSSGHRQIFQKISLKPDS